MLCQHFDILKDSHLVYFNFALFIKTISSVWYLSGCITQWFDHDDPNGNGDYELLSDLLNMYPGEICPIPVGIEAQTVSGQSSSNVFQV